MEEWDTLKPKFLINYKNIFKSMNNHKKSFSLNQKQKIIKKSFNPRPLIINKNKIILKKKKNYSLNQNKKVLNVKNINLKFNFVKNNEFFGNNKLKSKILKNKDSIKKNIIKKNIKINWLQRISIKKKKKLNIKESKIILENKSKNYYKSYLKL